ncbi:hypothetical protein [Streptomyces sp. NPDC050534]|uniref:hypothetical protein n=1 Tax=Streptomyces sp. NPDC050534 TaxID=3365625 RepID=UPI0037995448
MTTNEPRPAMTMRQIREGLGHIEPGQPDPIVQTTGYTVSCLPEDHDERWTYTVRVSYRGDGLWSVQCRSQYVDADGKRSPGFCWSRGPQEPATQAEMDDFDAEQAEWLKAYRFDHVTALRIAKQLAPTLTYRGRTVADALAEPVA